MSEEKNEAPKKEEVLLKTNKCEIVQKEDDRIVARCEGGAEVDLGKVSEEEVEEKIEQKGEECPECAGAIAAGWALSYVKPLEEAEADKLHQSLLNGEITSDEALDRSKAIAEKHGDMKLVDTITYLKELAHKPLSELDNLAEGQS